jgi:glycosyltransferase involved in cell wall biosynthesis
VDRFLCIGAANRRFYESLGQPQDKLCSAPYCVNNERFAREAASLRAERTSLRHAWGVPDSKFCILFCGKFVPKKRPTDVIEAVRRLGPSFHILFVGDGELSQQLRDATRPADGQSEGNSPDRTDHPTASFVGFLNQREIVRAYVAADCLVLPSDAGETWGLVVNEAMATGLPCITSNRCGCAEDLLPPEQIFPLADIAGLESCLKRLVAAPPAVTETIRRIERFAPSATAETVHRLLLTPSRSQRA